MSHSDSIALMEVLGGFKHPAQAMFVGGCVRNALGNHPVTDIDIATIHKPDAVMKMLLESGIRAIPTGMEHGTVTAVFPSMKFEITTLRKDIETDGRYAVIAFTDDWETDAKRRDFTFNTLLATPNGMVYDPTGKGIEDLEAGHVRFVGEPSQRIAEDYLRILRFFRFHAQYGKGELQPDALNACEAAAGRIATLSRERITQEFKKILATPHAASILKVMFSHGILKDLADPSYKPKMLAFFIDLQEKHDLKELTPRLFILGGLKSRDFKSWLVLSNEEKRALDILEKAYACLDKITKRKMREVVYRYGKQAALQACLIRLSKNFDYPDLEIIDIARYWQPPLFPVDGKVLIDSGMKPGKELGEKLQAMEEKWIASDFQKIPRI